MKFELPGDCGICIYEDEHGVIYVEIKSESSVAYYRERARRGLFVPGSDAPKGEWPNGLCEMNDIGNYKVIHSDVVRGYGPMMYDICIELATMLGKKVIPASAGRWFGFHMDTSDLANNLWKHYYENRKDVFHEPIVEFVDFDDEYVAIMEQNPHLYVAYYKRPDMINRVSIISSNIDISGNIDRT